MPPQARGEKMIAMVTELRKDLADLTGLPTTLQETGKVGQEDLEAVSLTAMNDGSMIVTPVEAGFPEIRSILEEVWG